MKVYNEVQGKVLDNIYMFLLICSQCCWQKQAASHIRATTKESVENLGDRST